MKKPANPITASIPLDEDGVHHGFLQLPFSRDESAWGKLMIPLTVIRNGTGPTALLTGANHGDEYEGPIALQSLAAELKQEDIKGRIIIVPAFNYPAFRAGTRTSPYDQGNLNRVFPGKPNGTVTEKIADFFQHSLIPIADAVLDFHSGGKTLEFVPFACAHELDDPKQQTACLAAMHAFNAPYSLLLREIDNVGMYDTAVEDQGKVFVSTELGGGGTATAKTVAIAKKGVKNFLIHNGNLPGELVVEPSTRLTMPDDNCFVFATREGLTEPLVDLASAVEHNQAIAQVWPTDRTGEKPWIYKAPRSGILAARHFPGLVNVGDCLALVAVEAED